MSDLLALGAHPDDVEIAIGGTLLKMRRQGASLALLDLTNGEPTPRGSVETRMAEAKAAAALLGAERITLDLRNRYLQDTIEARHLVARVIRKHRPKVLLAPWRGGAHPDHRAASDIAEAARFYAKLTKTDASGKEWEDPPWWTPRIFFYGLGIYREMERPAFLVDVSDVWEEKIELLDCYRSQDAVDRYRALPDPYGPLLGAAHAEPFFAKEPIGIRNLLDLA